MSKAKTVKGVTSLAVDAVAGVTNIVEGMYRNIAAKPLPWGEAPEGPARGIAGIVFTGINSVTTAIKDGVDQVGGPLADYVDKLVEQVEPHAGDRSDVRAGFLAALNGVLGDHLADRDNPLAIPMTLSVDSAFRDRPTGRLLIVIHGLCMNDRQWTRNNHNHGTALASDFDLTPAFLQYNSGRHVSINGKEFADTLEKFVADWPVPVESITLIGHSMGGLVIRSALATAPNWAKLVDQAFYIGTPHHGAVLERRGLKFQKRVEWSPYTAPLGALGMIRSAGITDLRHGNVVEADWNDPVEGDNRFAHHEDRRQPTPLAEGIAHFAIVASVAETSGELKGRLLGDGLVHPSSASGRHKNPAMQLQFPEQNIAMFRQMNHWDLLDDPRVYEQLKKWMGDK